MEIKVKPEDLRAFAGTLQEALNAYSEATVIKDEVSDFAGNDSASKHINSISKITNDFKETLNTFAETLNDFATSFEEKDK